MNKTRLVWGIICLAAAGVLAALAFILPPEDMVFMVGNANLPWAPAAILAVVGIILLAGLRSAGSAGQATALVGAAAPAVETPQAKLNRRLESAAWGLFLIMLGGFALVPDNLIPKGAWSVGVGLIMLGLNAARYFKGLRMSGFTTVVGILGVLGGIGELLGVTSLDGALLLIILGVYLIVKPYFEKRQLFGKAEEQRAA